MLVFIALTVIGLEFAIFFAVLSALLVVVPYFGAIAGAIPPVLLALTHSPGKALLVLVAYILVQQVEGNVIVPLVMSQTVRIHPAMIAIGVVVVGQLFGVAGLFVAVPILLIVISVAEFWVKPIEERNGNEDARSSSCRLPPSRSSRRRSLRSGQLRNRDHGADQHEDHDQQLDYDPEARHLHLSPR